MQKVSDFIKIDQSNIFAELSWPFQSCRWFRKSLFFGRISRSLEWIRMWTNICQWSSSHSAPHILQIYFDEIDSQFTISYGQSCFLPLLNNVTRCITRAMNDPDEPLNSVSKIDRLSRWDIWGQVQILEKRVSQSEMLDGQFQELHRSRKIADQSFIKSGWSYP